MTYRARRLLFFISMCAFLIISGPLLLYTFGFRFSFSDFTFRQTGGLFVHTTPVGARVSIGTSERTTSFLTGNIFIQNLPPGRHTVQISHDNYQSWERTVRIQPRTVTELSLVLAPVSPVHTPLAAASSTRMYVSPHASLIMLQAPETTTFFDTETKRTLPFADTSSKKIAAALPQTATAWYWNADETSALAETSNDWLLVNRIHNVMRVRSLYATGPLKNLLSKKPRSMILHPENENVFFLLDDENLLSWNMKTDALQSLLQSIAGFSINADHLLLWDMQSELPYVTLLNATQARPYATTSIPSVREAHIEEIGGEMLLRSNKGTWLLSPSGRSEQLADGDISRMRYTNAYVLWWDEHTVTIHWRAPLATVPTFQQKRQEVIYNTTATVRNILPYPEEQYVIVQEDNRIFTLELDGRGETRIKQTLYEGEDPSFCVPPEERILYVHDKGSVFTIDLP